MTDPFVAFIPTHIFCDNCGNIAPFKVDEISSLDTSGKFSGRDFTCINGHVVTTVFEEK